jgi:hypothetical protein
MTSYLYCYEKKLGYVFSVFLILFNLVSLYFIIDLLSYDEIVGYLTNGTIKSASTRSLAFLLFVNLISNLLFVSGFLMDRFFSR